MSTIRDPAYITDAGRTMMTAGGDVTYTKAVLYGQDISHLTDDQVKALTTIGSPLREVKVGISDKQNTDRGTTVILEATFQNDNLANDLPYTAVGFFAKRGDEAEKLVAVGVATEGAYLAATSPDGVATDALDIKVAIAIGDSANVTAMIDPAGSVTPAALHNAITDVKSEMKTGLDTKADKSQINVSGNLFNRMTDDSTWKAITGVDNIDNAILTSIRDDSPSGGNTTGGNGSAIAFGGSDTKAVLSVNWLQHEAKITSGNGSGPKWVEDVAWKSDVTNLQNQVNTKASASDVNSLNQTISALQQTIQSLQNTVNQQATQITGLQTLVNNQANEIKQLQETTIKGETFSKSQEADAEAWEKQNSQQIAFILDN